MRLNRYALMIASAALTMAACSDDDNNPGEVYEPTTYLVSGKVEKGPFVSGSAVTIQPMNGKLQVQGSMYSSTIKDDLGNFTFGSKLFEAPYAELAADGYFFNEVNGYLSDGTLHLLALADLSDEATVNVNLLTHLKYYRIRNLIKGGATFGEANKQAQEELFAAFGLQEYAGKDASLFSITEGTNEAAALIAISSLMLVDRSEAALTEYLAKLSREFGDMGHFSEKTKEQIRNDKSSLVSRLKNIKDNILYRYNELGLDVKVKDLQYFLDWDDDGVAGNELLKEGQSVTLEQKQLDVPNEGGEFSIGITAPVPVYLKSQTGDDEPLYPDNVSVDYGLYEYTGLDKICVETKIEDNALKVKVSPLDSRMDINKSIYLYDYVGNEVAELIVAQKGNGDKSMPRLGYNGIRIADDISRNIGLANSKLNILEQRYHYNKEGKTLNINAHSSIVDMPWGHLYTANRATLAMKKYDSMGFAVYQDILNVWNALEYYSIVQAWGDVPYIDDYSQYDSGEVFNMPRFSQKKIMADMKVKVSNAIKTLEEKKNVALPKDMNEYFFVSKDVARILLANMYMNDGEYNLAEPLLGKVIANGFYELDETNYNNPESINNLGSNGQGKEAILVTTNGDRGSRADIVIMEPTLVPIMNYTDVVLSYAECLYKNGKKADAERELKRVLDAKGANIMAKDALEGIKEARLQLTLYTNTNFHFMKRNKFATGVYDIQDYQLVLPIPAHELYTNTSLTQNPGY